jgi:hypothetical protein
MCDPGRLANPKKAWWQRDDQFICRQLAPSGSHEGPEVGVPDVCRGQWGPARPGDRRGTTAIGVPLVPCHLCWRRALVRRGYVLLGTHGRKGGPELAQTEQP